jgi:hypothetical protein
VFQVELDYQTCSTVPGSVDGLAVLADSLRALGPKGVTWEHSAPGRAGTRAEGHCRSTQSALRAIIYRRASYFYGKASEGRQ